MIDLPLLAAYLTAAAILTVTPGVDTAMILRSAAIAGRRAGFLAALGIGLGCLVWGAAVALGLASLLRASELGYALLRLGGAAYLVWLGARLLWKPRSALAGAIDAPVDSERSAFRRGLLTNLLNPKVGVFYVSFLPQFVPHGAPLGATIMLLVGLHVGLGLVWSAVLIGATARLTGVLQAPSAIRRLDRLTGLVFVGFGIKLAASTR